MIVVSDTTPLHYLIQIGEIDILRELFGQVIIPQAVFDEMQREKTPQEVKAWIDARPTWLEVRQADRSIFIPKKRLGDGEREALALAKELHADAVLMDDRDGITEAHRNTITTYPTITILRKAAQKKLLNLPEAIERLSSQTNFRLPPPQVIEKLLQEYQPKRDRSKAEFSD